MKHRIHAGNGEITSGSEIRLYCSDKCKENCPVYGQRDYRKDNKPISGRDVQDELRKIASATHKACKTTIGLNDCLFYFYLI